MEILKNTAKFIDEGGPIEYFIVALMLLGLSIILERVWFFFIKCRINAKKLLADATALIRKDKIGEARKLCASTGTPLGLILEAGIWKYEQSAAPEEIKDALEEVALREVPRLQKRTHYLGLLANLCTLVGLLGTIFGLQEAFSALEAADPSQKSKLLAKGITLALNATALGLVSAMLCMAGFTWLGSKANHLLEQIDETVLRLVNFLNSQRKMTPDRRPIPAPHPVAASSSQGPAAGAAAAAQPLAPEDSVTWRAPLPPADYGQVPDYGQQPGPQGQGPAGHGQPERPRPAGPKPPIGGDEGAPGGYVPPKGLPPRHRG